MQTSGLGFETNEILKEMGFRQMKRNVFYHPNAEYSGIGGVIGIDQMGRFYVVRVYVNQVFHYGEDEIKKAFRQVLSEQRYAQNAVDTFNAGLDAYRRKGETAEESIARHERKEKENAN